MKIALTLIAVPIVISAANHNRGDELYDHMDGVLDKNEALDIDKMSEEEKREKLLAICKKIDTDSNMELSQKELELWMHKTSERYMSEDVGQQFPAHDKDGDGKVTWDEYYESVFGFMTDEDFQDQSLSKDQMVSRDKRRFSRADLDNDEVLSKEEFAGFLHPEDHEHMRDIVVQETLEDLDKNGDGAIDQSEYIADMYHEADSNGEEPEWLKIEIEHFKTIRDQDGDGLMHLKEVRDWLMPLEYNHIEAEAQHLITECDKDESGLLSFNEVLDHYDVFFTSQATNWGEAFAYHDEL